MKILQRPKLKRLNDRCTKGQSLINVMKILQSSKQQLEDRCTKDSWQIDVFS